MSTDIITPPDGIHEGIPFADYLAWDALSSTQMRQDRRSMRHARYAADHARPETSALAKGTLTHALLLEGVDAAESRFAREPREIMADPKYSKPRQGGPYQEWKAQQTLPIISDADWESAYAMADELCRSPLVGKILRAPGMREVSLIATDPETGLRIKGRLDLLGRHIVDIKSAADGSPDAFARSVWKFGYHMQAAHYRHLVHILTGEFRPVVFLVAENTPPHEVALYDMTEWIGHGIADNRKEMIRWADAKRSGVYPGYPDHIVMLPVPKWIERQLDAQDEQKEWVA